MNLSLIDGYIKTCTEKVNYHNEMSNRCSAWNFWLTTVALAVSASQGLVMAILGFDNSNDAKSIAIIGASYSLVLVIVNSVKNSYSFLQLGEKHDNLSNRFNELRQSFILIKESDPENITNDNNNIVYRISITKFIMLKNQHLQHVSQCRSLLCCLSQQPID